MEKYGMIPLHQKTNQGLSLVELLVAMTIGLLVLGAVLQIFASQNRTSAVQQEIVYAQQNVRAAMDVMVREIRNAGHDPQNGGFGAIQAATATTIQVRADYSDPDGDGRAEGDGDASDANEDVTYTVNGSNQLTRDDANDALPANRIVDFVNTLLFSYEFADGDTGIPDEADADDTNDLDDIRLVTVELEVRTENMDPDTRRYRYRKLVNKVRIRNMGFQDID